MVRRAVITVVTAVILLAVTAGCAGTPSVTRPSEWATPAPEIISATKEYLAGDGADVVTVLDQAVTLAKGGTNPATCQEVLNALGATGGQYQFRLVAAGIPDPALADLALSTATVMSDALIACVGEATPGATSGATPATPVDQVGLGDALAQLSQLNQLTALRLKELQ